ncbi:hypothetical protein [Streptomyces sp. NPDC048200]|uniref:hypothetical protein n=1 Tax=Streptomyces sp. NPDC048200 TaxID=3365512 RepID=UPI00371552B3
MASFFGFGGAGIVLLVLSLVLDGVLEGLFDAVDLGDGFLDGLLSLPVIAGFLSERPAGNSRLIRAPSLCLHNYS